MPICASKLHPFVPFSNMHFCKTTAHLNFLSKFVYLFRLPDFPAHHGEVEVGLWTGYVFFKWFTCPFWPDICTQRNGYIFPSLSVMTGTSSTSQTESQVSPFQFLTVVRNSGLVSKLWTSCIHGSFWHYSFYKGVLYFFIRYERKSKYHDKPFSNVTLSIFIIIAKSQRLDLPPPRLTKVETTTF